MVNQKSRRHISVRNHRGGVKFSRKSTKKNSQTKNKKKERAYSASAIGARRRTKASATSRKSRPHTRRSTTVQQQPTRPTRTTLREQKALANNALRAHGISYRDREAMLGAMPEVLIAKRA